MGSTATHTQSIQAHAITPGLSSSNQPASPEEEEAEEEAEEVAVEAEAEEEYLPPLEEQQRYPLQEEAHDSSEENPTISKEIVTMSNDS